MIKGGRYVNIYVTMVPVTIVQAFNRHVHDI